MLQVHRKFSLGHNTARNKSVSTNFGPQKELNILIYRYSGVRVKSCSLNPSLMLNKFHLVTCYLSDFRSFLSDLLFLLAILSHSPALGLELGSFKNVAAKRKYGYILDDKPMEKYWERTIPKSCRTEF